MIEFTPQSEEVPTTIASVIGIIGRLEVDEHGDVAAVIDPGAEKLLTDQQREALESVIESVRNKTMLLDSNCVRHPVESPIRTLDFVNVMADVLERRSEGDLGLLPNLEALE